MPIPTEEWMRQADYDLQTARAMFDAGRFFYAVFMCHLALEKGLKGIWAKQKGTLPPKTHNLVYLLQETSVVPPEPVRELLVRLNTASVATRYPENLETVQQNFTTGVVSALMHETQEALSWLQSFCRS